MEHQLIVLTLLALVGSGFALECYVCQNQMDNKDKCVKTSVQCREEEDTCLTQIEWRAPDFWTPRSEKIHYVHKSCNTSSRCSDLQKQAGLKCMRDWYRDWVCFECCQGDRCNFYVTLGASGLSPGSKTVLATLMASMFVFYWWR